MADAIATTTYVIDITDQTFAAEVLERSKTTPVVVDFWAAWCGPCRALGPILEKLAQEYQGAFILAKLDVDKNPATAQQFQVQGIPAVKAFRNGQLASEFTGALPEPQVRKFLAALIPSEADLLYKQGYEGEVKGQLNQATAGYHAALERQPDHYLAILGLGRVLFSQGQIDEGVKALERIPAGRAERSAADALIATAQFQKYATGHTVAQLTAAIEADPKDMASRYALACLYATQNQLVPALAQFLEVVRRNRKYNDDGARKAMLAIFTIIGEDQPIVREYRQKLANALF